MNKRQKMWGIALACILALTGTALPGDTARSIKAAEADTPPNPLEKPGYTLLAHDEFNGKLDENLWLKTYLPHWISDTSLCKPHYDFEDGVLRLRIDKEQQPWNLAHDKKTVVSSIQSAEKDYLHHFTGCGPLDHHEETVEKYLQKYGYFEIRAKMQSGEGIHSAWWMVGFQQDAQNWNDSQQNCEIDIFEAPGRGETNKVKFNVIGWNDNNINNTWPLRELEVPFNTSEAFHIYGFAWDETTMKLYVDGKLVAVTDQSVKYPMLTLLGLYEKRHLGWTGQVDPDQPYPKLFQIDYWRAYQRDDMLARYNEAEDQQMTGSCKNDVWRAEASGHHLARFIGNGQQNQLIFDHLYSAKAGNFAAKIAYMSGENRDLYMSVNGGAPLVLRNLNSGGFKKIGETTVKIPLQAGNNEIRLFNPQAPAPDIDALSLTPVGNLARSAHINAESMDLLHKADCLNDGNPESYYHSQYKLVQPFNLDLNWDQEVEAKRIVLEGWSGSDNGVKALEAYGSQDGVHYELLKSFKNLQWESNDHTLERNVLELDHPVKMKFLRLKLTDFNSPDLGVLLNEIEVY